MSENKTIGIEKQTRAETSKWARRGGLAGMLGGILWAAWPLGTPLFLAQLWETGTMDVMGRIYGAYAAIPLALVMIGLVGLHTLHKGHYGRLGKAGYILSFGALSIMLIGLVLDAIAYGTVLSDIGNIGVLLGFLLSIIGSIALGLAVFRARILRHARVVGLAFSVAIPAGIAVEIVGSGLMPLGGDLWFFIGLMMAYGLAWIAVGYDLHTTMHSASSVSEPTTA